MIGFILRIFYAKMYKSLTLFLKGAFGLGHVSIWTVISSIKKYILGRGHVSI